VYCFSPLAVGLFTSKLINFILTKVNLRLNNLSHRNKNLLQNKGESTKFQILLEIMRHQPHIKQKDISDKLDITIQAVNKYFKKLQKEGYLEAGSERADYHLTPKAKTKIAEDTKNLANYINTIQNELKIERALPAIATQNVKAGQEVGLIMKEGVMYTVSTDNPAAQAKGITLSDAKAGEDLGLKELHGKVKNTQGKILIIKLPSIRSGGSRAVDLVKVKELYNEFKPDRIGVMGAVGRAVLTKLKLKADIEFGISRSAAIAASRGLNIFVLVVGRMSNRMTQEIENINMKNAANITYEVRDAKISQPTHLQS
jgi:putative transcriptional regulator